MLMTFLLLTITDLASSHDVNYTYVYDEVLVSVYNLATDEADPLQGYSYPSSFATRKYYRKGCNLEIYTVTPSGTRCVLFPQLSFSSDTDCTFVYYEDNCTAGLIQLAERARRDGIEAIIYRTQLINEKLRSLTDANVSIPVILVEDPEYVIRGYRYKHYRYVNITLIGQLSLPSTKPQPHNNGFDNSTTIFIVGFMFAALLLVGILVLSLAIFVYHKRHHRRTRQMVRNQISYIVIIFVNVLYDHLL